MVINHYVFLTFNVFILLQWENKPIKFNSSLTSIFCYKKVQIVNTNLLCSWERYFEALYPAWRTWRAVLNFRHIRSRTCRRGREAIASPCLKLLEKIRIFRAVTRNYFGKTNFCLSKMNTECRKKFKI